MVYFKIVSLTDWLEDQDIILKEIRVLRIRVKGNSNRNMRRRLRALIFELITVLSVTTDSETDSDFEPDQSIKG